MAAIAKGFPKGYIIHTKGMERFAMPMPGWIVVEHCGQAEDGLEVFVLVERFYPYKTKQGAIKHLQFLREIGVTD